MIGGNENFRRASSHENLFSSQETRSGTGSIMKFNPNEEFKHLPDHQINHDLPSFENRDNLSSRTRKMSSYVNNGLSSNRASTDFTSIWGPMESMSINSVDQSSRVRTNSHETYSSPRFSEKFLFEDPLMPRLMAQNSLSAQKQTLSHNSASTLDNSFDSAQKSILNSNTPSFSGSNWDKQSRAAFSNPQPGPLKKSASMASLPFVEQYCDSSSFMRSSNSNMNVLADIRSLDFSLRSATSAPHSREHTVSSDYLSTQQSGYCSRGSRCFYLHNTKVINPHHHHQQQMQPSVLSATANHLQFTPSSQSSNFSPVFLTAPTPSYSSQITITPSHPPEQKQEQSYYPQLSGLDSRPSSSKTANTSFIKKSALEEDANRYANMNIEDLNGQYHDICKDQFGCRYLQKQIEESPQKAISFIFQDIFNHFTELMTDPFGNYLCQKLLEFCDETQIGMIVAKVAPNLVAISLNMHGTRAVQKLIENVTDLNQIKTITNALAAEAVKLIKDLNGNHVIQKCLSKLSSPMNQFVFDAVSTTIVNVATHRHGCCVLQRCIDHAVDAQKLQLVKKIASNVLALVQDPFGNYVVQYVLDLEDESYSSYIVHPFIGNVCSLSVQKFSSNVIEKCIRLSNYDLRKQLIEELLDRSKLEVLLRDSYANYVVQTALDYADSEQKKKLIGCIKPMLPVIRTTPYGKRIQSKLARCHAE